MAKRKKAKSLPDVEVRPDPRPRPNSTHHSLCRPVASTPLTSQTPSVPPSPLAHPDLLRSILRYADDLTLANCLRVDHLFFDIAGSILYRTLNLGVWYSSDWDPEEGVSIDQGVKTRRQARPPMQRQEQLLKYTKVAVWRSHVGGCPSFRSMTPVEVPILQLTGRTGRTAGNVYTARKAYTAGMVYSRKIKFYDPCRASRCRLLHHLRAHKVVSQGDEPIDGLYWLDWTIDKAVYREWRGKQLYPHSQARFVRRITIVFPLQSALRVCEWAFRSLAILQYDMIGQITFLNTESLDRESLDVPEGVTTQDHFQSHLFTAIDEYIESHTTQEERKAVHAKISFMGLREYLASHDWEGEFEPEEVRQWLD
jgi:hypothetical protein